MAQKIFKSGLAAQPCAKPLGAIRLIVPEAMPELPIKAAKMLKNVRINPDARQNIEQTPNIVEEAALHSCRLPFILCDMITIFVSSEMMI